MGKKLLDINGKELKIGDEVQHPLYFPTGRVENKEGDIRIACHGYESKAANKCTKL
jgi:hypothetical protein